MGSRERDPDPHEGREQQRLEDDHPSQHARAQRAEELRLELRDKPHVDAQRRGDGREHEDRQEHRRPVLTDPGAPRADDHDRHRRQEGDRELVELPPPRRPRRGGGRDGWRRSRLDGSQRLEELRARWITARRASLETRPDDRVECSRFDRPGERGII